MLCVLMLRGAQTPGELKQRTARLHPFVGLDEIHETLERLAARELAERLPRRPGQKEERYRHLLGADDGTPGAAAGPDTSSMGSPAPLPAPDLEARVAALEAEVARLRAALAASATGRAAGLERRRTRDAAGAVCQGQLRAGGQV